MKKLNQRGFSVVEGVVSIGLSMMTIYVSMSLYNTYRLQGNNLELTTTVFQLRQNLISLVSNQDSWDQSVILNAAAGLTQMGCLIPPISPDDPPPYPDYVPRRCRNLEDYAEAITLYDTHGVAVFKPDPSAGFTKYGKACDTFSSSGNDNCPINVKVGWTAACSEPDPATNECLNTQSLISVTFSYKPNSALQQLAFNAASFSFKDQPRIVLSATDTPVTACAKIGKFYLPVVPPDLSPDSGAPSPEGCVPFDIFDSGA